MTNVAGKPRVGTPRRTFVVSDELWYAARAKALKQGVALGAVIRAALRAWVEQDERPLAKKGGPCA